MPGNDNQSGKNNALRDWEITLEKKRNPQDGTTRSHVQKFFFLFPSSVVGKRRASVVFSLSLSLSLSLSSLTLSLSDSLLFSLSIAARFSAAAASTQQKDTGKHWKGGVGGWG